MTSLLKLLSTDGYIPVNKILAKLLGINEAILIGEFITEYQYYESHGMLTEDNGFYSTIENVEENTSLNEFAQRKAVKHLVQEGILKVERKGIPAKRYIYIDQSRLESILKYETLETSSLKIKDLYPYDLRNKTPKNQGEIIINNKNNNKREEAIDTEKNIEPRDLDTLTKSELELLKKILIENRESRNIAYRDIQKMFNLVDTVSYDTPSEINNILKRINKEEKEREKQERILSSRCTGLSKEVY